MKPKAKDIRRIKAILKTIDDHPGSLHVCPLPKFEFEEVRNYLGEPPTVTEFKYKNTVIKQI